MTGVEVGVLLRERTRARERQRLLALLAGFQAPRPFLLIQRLLSSFFADLWHLYLHKKDLSECSSSSVDIVEDQRTCPASSPRNNPNGAYKATEITLERSS